MSSTTRGSWRACSSPGKFGRAGLRPTSSRIRTPKNHREDVSLESPATPREALEQAHRLKGARKYSEALRTLDAALERWPHNATIIGQKAHTLHLSGRTDEGLVLLDESEHRLELPDFVLSIRAELLAGVGRHDEALRGVDALLARATLTEPARRRALEVLHRRGQQARVDAELQRWIDETRGPGRKPVRILALKLSADPDVHLAALRAEFPDDLEVLEIAARHQLADLPPDEKAEELGVLIATSRGADSQKLRMDQALALRKAKRPEEARDALLACLAANPEDAFAHAHLGYCLRDLGDHAQAARAFEEALRRNPNDNYARRAYYASRRAADDFQGAERFTEEMAAAHGGGWWGAFRSAFKKPKRT